MVDRSRFSSVPCSWCGDRESPVADSSTGPQVIKVARHSHVTAVTGRSIAVTRWRQCAPLLCSRHRGALSNTMVHLSVPWCSCHRHAAALGYRHAGCLQLSHVPTADVDSPRVELPGWLPRTGISSRTLHSVIEYGLPLLLRLFAAAYTGDDSDG